MKPLSVIDHLVSKSQFKLVLDNETTALKTTPELSEEELKQYYPTSGYASHQTRTYSLTAKIYALVKRINIQTKLNWICKYAPKGRLLDYGAGNGEFALAAQKQGWDTCVYETSSDAIEILNQRQLRTIAKPHQENQFEVITLWHVFEHLNNPKDSLDALYKSLKPGGTLVLAIPNTGSWGAKHYKSYWAAYDVPRHRWHYNKHSILLLGRKSGFALAEIKNMYWDAFYISLLSEQYQNAKAPCVKAFCKGLYANIKGAQTKNTSSLTFFFQKPK